MSATGLAVFDKTLQTTHIWLGELMQDEAIGPDRQAMTRPVNLREGTRAVFRVLSHHVNRGQIEKVDAGRGAQSLAGRSASAE